MKFLREVVAAIMLAVVIALAWESISNTIDKSQSSVYVVFTDGQVTGTAFLKVQGGMNNREAIESTRKFLLQESGLTNIQITWWTPVKDKPKESK